MTALISLRDAVVAYDGAPSPALDGVSLDVAPGSWIAAAGGNGSGKSTLLAALAGLLPLRSGRSERAARRVAMLMQDPDNQLVSSNVAGELALSLDMDAPGRDARVDEAVERFSLAAFLDRNPHRLSGGEKQRLAMATVWLESPDVLLLDEPLAFLDPENRERVLGFVRELNADGTAVVWATPGEDAAFAKEALVLDAGRVVFYGPASDAPREMRAAEPASAEPVAHAAGDDVFRMEGVAFAYDGVPVFDGVDLHATGGERIGVVGPNSAGKSTLLLVVGGALAPSSGRVTHPAADAFYLPQSPERLFFAETVREELAFGMKRRGIGDIESRSRAALERCGLMPGAFLDRSPFQLSFGEMRRVAFAIADSLAPSLLLLDEPASCLDAAGRRVLADLVRRRAAAAGAVLLASHDLSHLEEVSDRIVPLTRSRRADSIPADSPTRRH